MNVTIKTEKAKASQKSQLKDSPPATTPNAREQAQRRNRRKFRELRIGDYFRFTKSSNVACGKYNSVFCKSAADSYRGVCFTGYPDLSVAVNMIAPQAISDLVSKQHDVPSDFSGVAGIVLIKESLSPDSTTPQLTKQNENKLQ